jgi:hypothetical protein
VGSGAFSGDAKPPGLDIYRSVDCLSICEIESYMKKGAFTNAYLSDIRVIMTIMRVPMIELLC